MDLRRLRGFVPVLLGLCACLWLGHVALARSLGEDPAWLRDDAAVDWSYYQLFGSQVAGAEWEARHRPEIFPERFGVLIGASTIQRGPLPRELQARTGEPWLLLGIGGGFGAFTKIGRSLRVLEATGLRPDTLVLGVHPLWLSAAPPAKEAGSWLGELWFVRHQLQASNFMYDRMQAGREALSRRLGFGTWAAFVPAERPWQPPIEKPIERAAAPAELAERLQQHARLGRFAAAGYPSDGPQVRELEGLLARVGRLSRRVVVVLLPEHSEFRRSIPTQAARLLVGTVQRSAPAATQLLDLRDALPDDQFADTYHLTMDGRRALSALLAERVGP